MKISANAIAPADRRQNLMIRSSWSAAYAGRDRIRWSRNGAGAVRRFSRLGKTMKGKHLADDPLLPNAKRNHLAYEQGLALHFRGNLSEASAIYEAIVAAEPIHFDAVHMLGVIALQRGDAAKAAALIDRAIEINPRADSAYTNCGAAFLALGQMEEAILRYDGAIALNPRNADAHTNRGGALARLGRWGEALTSYDQTVAINPQSADAYFNRATALLTLGRKEEAVRDCDIALTLGSKNTDVLLNRGKALLDLGRTHEALASYDKAIEIAPQNSLGHYGRGLALLNLNQPEGALASFDTAISLAGDNASAHANRGNALSRLNRVDEALASYDRAIALNPRNASIHQNQGVLLFGQGKISAALSSFEAALAIDPEYPLMLGLILHLRMRLCRWKDFHALHAKLRTDILAGKNATTPFGILALFDDAEIQKRAASTYVGKKYSTRPSLPPIALRRRGDKIRIGYYSADFRQHIAAQIFIQLFEAHDRSRFELIGFSYGPHADDAVRARIAASLDRFIDVRDRSDRDIASLSRDLGIDIAFEIGGHTLHARPGLFIERCAPIQINGGYPGTSGSRQADYFFADKTNLPTEIKEAFSEKIAWLRGPWLVDGSKPELRESLPTRALHGLPEKGFVFCSFNNSYKILPDVFDIWMRLLKAVDGSVLWMRMHSPEAMENLRKEAEVRSVERHRLIFTTRVPFNEHIARHQLADLFLDNLPYGAQTTASDALWAGLPLLTCVGQSFPARIAASMLTTIGARELIADSLADYEAKALDFARDATKLAAVRRKITENRVNSPLFDARCYARDIEEAYTAIYERAQAGLPPDHIRLG